LILPTARRATEETPTADPILTRQKIGSEEGVDHNRSLPVGDAFILLINALATTDASVVPKICLCFSWVLSFMALNRRKFFVT
jgi:hypothetical protein